MNRWAILVFGWMWGGLVWAGPREAVVAEAVSVFSAVELSEAAKEIEVGNFVEAFFSGLLGDGELRTVGALLWSCFAAAGAAGRVRRLHHRRGHGA